MIDLSEDPVLNKDLRYLVVLQLSFRNPLQQELVLITRLHHLIGFGIILHKPSRAVARGVLGGRTGTKVRA